MSPTGRPGGLGLRGAQYALLKGQWTEGDGRHGPLAWMPRGRLRSATGTLVSALCWGSRSRGQEATGHHGAAGHGFLSGAGVDGPFTSFPVMMALSVPSDRARSCWGDARFPHER